MTPQWQIMAAEEGAAVGQWLLRAQAHAFLGEPLRIGVDEYAELVRLRLALDPLDAADHSKHLFGTPLEVT